MLLKMSQLKKFNYAFLIRQYCFKYLLPNLDAKTKDPWHGYRHTRGDGRAAALHLHHEGRGALPEPGRLRPGELRPGEEGGEEPVRLPDLRPRSQELRRQPPRPPPAQGRRRAPRPPIPDCDLRQDARQARGRREVGKRGRQGRILGQV